MTTVEAVEVFTPLLYLEVADAITVTEWAYGQATGYEVSVADAMTVGELIALSFIAIGKIDATLNDWARWTATLNDWAVTGADACNDVTRT